MTAFGPQSANYTTTRPPTDAAVSAGVDTWFKDCSGVGVMDGTIPTASWFNVMIAQMRTAATNAGVTTDDTNDAMLWQSMLKAGETAAGTLTASRGIERDSDNFQMTIGSGSDPVLTMAGIDPLNDLVVIYDDSGNAIAETNVHNLVSAALAGVVGLDRDAGAGTISGTVTKQTVGAAPPAGANPGDTHFDTDTDELFMRVSVGAGDRWIQIA